MPRVRRVALTATLFLPFAYAGTTAGSLLGVPSAAATPNYCNSQFGSTFTGWFTQDMSYQQEANVGISGYLQDPGSYFLCTGTPSHPEQVNGQTNSIWQWLMVQGRFQANEYDQFGTVGIYGQNCVFAFVQGNDNNSYPDNQFDGCSPPGNVIFGECWETYGGGSVSCEVWNSGAHQTVTVPVADWSGPWSLDASAEVKYLQDSIAGNSSNPYLYGLPGAGQYLSVEDANYGWHDACAHANFGSQADEPSHGVALITCDQFETWEAG
jgi:hypothetical protein